MYAELKMPIPPKTMDKPSIKTSNWSFSHLTTPIQLKINTHLMALFRHNTRLLHVLSKIT